MILKEFESLQRFLAGSKKIVILGHKNPDGDAIGSTLALHLYLKKKGHQSTVVVPNDFPDFLKWMPHASDIYRFDVQNNQSVKALKRADLVFMLDFNALHRLGDDMESKLKKGNHTFAMIDHHLEPEEVAYMYSDTSICSTCQMVYQFIELNNDLHLIDEAIATCIYTGIMTDTGSFRFRTTTSTTHRIIANLIDFGAKNDRIHGEVYDTNSHERLLLLGRALQNLTVLKEYNTAYITISQKEKETFNFQKGDTEGVVNYALSVKDVIFAAIFIEDLEQNLIKISFRSKGDFCVNDFARTYFEGGGHKNAAGGKYTNTLPKTIAYFKSILPKVKNELLKSNA